MGLNVAYNETKSQALIARLAQTGAAKVKMMKLIYFIDFISIARNGRSITGSTYVAMKHGPVPAAVFYSWEYPNPYYVVEHKPLPNGKWADIAREQQTPPRVFSSEEEMIIEEVIQRYGGMDTQQIVDESHNQLPWTMADENEEIDMDFAAYADYKRPSDEQLKQLQQNPRVQEQLREAYLESLND